MEVIASAICHLIVQKNSVGFYNTSTVDYKTLQGIMAHVPSQWHSSIAEVRTAEIQVFQDAAHIFIFFLKKILGK